MSPLRVPLSGRRTVDKIRPLYADGRTRPVVRAEAHAARNQARGERQSPAKWPRRVWTAGRRPRSSIRSEARIERSAQ